jgi:GMP synthase-like glutamine amidotransferase
LVKVLAVNNYPTEMRFRRLTRCIEENDAELASVTWEEATAKLFDSFDGVALSGSPDMMSEPRVQAKYAAEISAIRETKSPVLGVCFGHQMIAHAFGSQVVKDRHHVLKFVNTTLLSDGGLFEGLPRQAMLLESRHEVVRSVPTGFDLLASSETSPIAAMKHRTLPLYSVQSHPERWCKAHPEGKTLVGNFVRLLR